MTSKDKLRGWREQSKEAEWRSDRRDGGGERGNTGKKREIDGGNEAEETEVATKEKISAETGSCCLHSLIS